MSPAGYVMLRSQVEVIDKLIEQLSAIRREARHLVDAGFKAEVMDSLDVSYRLLYDGKVNLLAQMHHPCVAG